MGLMDAKQADAPEAPAAEAPEKLTEPLLVQVKRDVEAQVPKELKDAYDRVIVAGLKLMYSDQTHRYLDEYLAQTKDSKNPAQMIAHGLMKLLQILFKESQGKLSVEAAFPAITVLMCYALEDLEQRYQIDVTPKLIADTTRAVTAGYLTLFDIPGKMKQGQPGRPGPAQPTPPGQPAQPQPMQPEAA